MRVLVLILLLGASLLVQADPNKEDKKIRERMGKMFSGSWLTKVGKLKVIYPKVEKNINKERKFKLKFNEEGKLNINLPDKDFKFHVKDVSVGKDMPIYYLVATKNGVEFSTRLMCMSAKKNAVSRTLRVKTKAGQYSFRLWCSKF